MKGKKKTATPMNEEMALIKRDVIRDMKRRTGYSEDLCRMMVDAFLETVVDGCKTYGKVKFNGFGIFTRRDRPAREARDPRNGEIIKVGARRSIHFSPTRTI